MREVLLEQVLDVAKKFSTLELEVDVAVKVVLYVPVYQSNGPKFS